MEIHEPETVFIEGMRVTLSEGMRSNNSKVMKITNSTVCSGEVKEIDRYMYDGKEEIVVACEAHGRLYLDLVTALFL